MASIEEFICFFMDILPPELRVRIYEMVLTFDHPLRLESSLSSPYTHSPAKNTAILKVSRTTNTEAVPIFYALNTIAAKRSDFCRRRSSQHRLPFKPRLIRSLYIVDLEMSPACSAIFEDDKARYRVLVASGRHRHPPCEPSHVSSCPKSVCRGCEPSLLKFLHDLCLLPQLKKVVVNHGNDFKDLLRLRNAIQVEAPSSTLRCVRIGEFLLEGEGLKPLRVILRNVPLIEACNRILLPGKVWTGYHEDWLDITPRTMNMALRLNTIMRHHDDPSFPGFPRLLSVIWPNDLPQDLWSAERLGENRPNFLYALTLNLELLLS